MFSVSQIVSLATVDCETGLLGRPFSAVGFFKDAFVASGYAAFAWGALFSADALHLEPPADGTCSEDIEISFHKMIRGERNK